MKIKTAEATPSQLDWLVAKCEKVASLHTYYGKPCVADGQWSTEVNYSTNWAQGGPIIDREISATSKDVLSETRYVWHKNDIHRAYGDTLLIASMRCYVASKLGDEVEVPEVLCQN